VPPLRERQEDIPMLVTHFSEKMANREGGAPRVFSDAAIERLKTLAWPGNVRELRNTVERLLILSDGNEIDSNDVDSLTTSRAGFIDAGRELLKLDNFGEFKEKAECAYIMGKLRANEWNVAETARRIKMPRSNLYKKIEKYGLVRED
jgi:two-component system nitrogen regulation response regulator NtrX